MNQKLKETIKYLDNLYRKNRANGSIDPVDISLELEKYIMECLDEYNISRGNLFLDSLLEIYRETGTLSERQWFHIIRFWLRLFDIAEYQPAREVDPWTTTPDVKGMLARLKESK